LTWNQGLIVGLGLVFVDIFTFSIFFFLV